MAALTSFLGSLFGHRQGDQAATHALLGTIRHLNTFSALPEETLLALCDKLQEMPVKKGQAIIRQGEDGAHFYVIAEGTVTVTKAVSPNAENSVVATLGPGDAFGEEALISNARRNATVTMTANGSLFRLAKSDFDELLKEPVITWVSRVQAFRDTAAGTAAWLDVSDRKSAARRNALPGARCIPLADLRTQIPDLDRKQSYICCCQTGRQSATAAFLLTQMGFKAAVLRGGLQRVPGYETAGEN